ncbi:hypothetical protein K1719_034131 [Acacia pycnantha]|nr:hypothetical protein K1719_034131 [Acacia pycnantha]
MEDNQILTLLVWKVTNAKKTLIGKFLSNKMYTRVEMESILRKARNLQVGFDVVEINGNTFMFNFSNEEEYCRILRGCPWSVNGFLLNLLERSRYNSCEELDFSRSPVWIQMHNVLLEAMCLENTIAIGGQAGEVMIAEDPYHNDRYHRCFLRARVLLDLRKPLAYGFWLPRPDG